AFMSSIALAMGSGLLPDTETIVLWDHEEQELFPVAPTLVVFLEQEQQLLESAMQAEDFLLE
ncbi:hypothetical protein, partial [Proteus mirabilis]|uniref:hypothetical protein n=1 Tax=Proteus mirabilis TaxID=584 RepID=UPI001952BC66